MSAPVTAAPRRRGVVALLAVAALLVLTACGARIDTTLVLAGDGSGERVMRLTLAEDDVEDIEGGIAAVEASVRAHLPEQLTMSDVETTDDGYVATMTLAFTSTEDYTTKVAALLEASGSDRSADVVHTVTDTAFLRGTKVDEGFTSADLLGWVGKGLLADGLVDEDEADAAVENGDTAVKVGEKEYESGSYAGVEDILDHGMRELEVTTSRSEAGFTRVVVLGVPSDTYAAEAAALDAAVEALVPAGSIVTAADVDSSHRWTVTFSGDAAAISAGTDTLLGTSGSVWSWTESQGAAGQVVEVVDTFTCGTTCSPDLRRATAQHVVPVEWTRTGDHWVLDEVDGQAYVRSDGEEPSVYEVPLLVARVDADLALDRAGAGTATLVFSLPTTAAGDGAAIEALLRPAEGLGTLERTDDGTTTRVTVTVDGETAEELSDRLDDYAGIDYEARDRGDTFAIDLRLQVELALDELLPTPPAEGVHATVHLPVGAKVELGTTFWGEGPTLDGRTFTWVDEDGYSTYVTADVTGATVAGLVRTGVVVLLVLGLVGVVVWQRRRIAAWWAAAQAASRARTAALGIPDAVAPRADDVFTEAQLR